MNLAIVGCGAVGRAVCDLAESYGHRITALADSTSAVTDAAGIDVETALERKIRDGTVGSADPERALDAEYDVLVEATPTTLDDAEPGFSHVLGALERDRHVVLANKGPVAERYDDLRSAERDSAGRVLFEATVGGAIPVLSTIADLGAENVSAVRGVLNGTANFILSRMSAEGLGYEHVLAEAQDLGVAETDPTFDVEGTDAALKCAILANVVGTGETTLADVEVTGITELTPSALSLAREGGRTIRLVGEVTDGDDQTVRVGPRLVPEHGALSVSGTRNIVQLETHNAGQLNLSGCGAGGEATASAVFADIARLQ